MAPSPVLWGIMGHKSFKSHQDRTDPTGILQMSLNKWQMSVNTRHLSGEHAAMFGEHVALFGEHAAMFGEHVALFGEHAALFGEHAALFGEHAALFGEHAAFVSRQSPPCYPVATARGTDLIAVASSHLIATAPGAISGWSALQ